MTVYDAYTAKFDDAHRAAVVAEQQHRDFAVALVRGFAESMEAPPSCIHFRALDGSPDPDSDDNLATAVGFEDDGWFSIAFAIAFERPGGAAGCTRVSCTFAIRQDASGDWVARWNPLAKGRDIGQSVRDERRTQFYYDAAIELRDDVITGLSVPSSADTARIGFHVSGPGRGTTGSPPQ